MPRPLRVRTEFGSEILLVEHTEILEIDGEAQARRFLEELGEKVVDSVDPRALPSGLRSDFEGAGENRDEQLAVLAQMLSSGQFAVVRLQRPFRRLDPVRSVPLSSLRRTDVEDPAPTKVKETFAYEVRVVDELGEPVAGVPVSLSVSGSSRRLVTDGDGRVKVDDGTTGSSVVQLPDFAALQDALRSRWEQAREGEWLNEPVDHTYIDCAVPLPSVKIQAERLHTIVVQPRVICARVLELLFDTNKSFLLPSALEHIRAIRRLYHKRPHAKLLVVGHTDVTGEPHVNDPLSLNRAKAVMAYLRDDVKTWIGFYGQHMHAKARWGGHEDHLMLQAVLAESGEELTDTPLRHFQATRGLDPDGKLGPITRETIITEYMAIDGTTLPASVEPIAHGCGEHFPLDQADTEDTASAHARDRRVELFFFDADLGVLPAPSGDNSGPGSLEYPEWRRRSFETHTFIPSTITLSEVNLRLHDEDRNPMPGVPFIAKIGKVVLVEGVSDDEGFAFVPLPPVCPERILVRWGEDPIFDYAHELDIFPDCFPDNAQSSNVARLHNLGYAPTIDLEAAVLQFQADYGVDADPEPIGLVDGALPPATQQRLDAIWFEKNSNATRG
jgi:outer membrane protein OmpA-like peptidoglycan-associated protein